MNIFRLAGDLSHLFAMAFLPSIILASKSCARISAKTQILYLIVFCTRYLDLVTNFVSLYNTVAKIAFIILTSITIYLVRVRYSNTYDRVKDTFWISTLLVPSFILAIVFNHEMSTMEVLWTFSIYLEAVAIVPQLFMIEKLPFQGMYSKTSDNIDIENLDDDAHATNDGLGQYVPIELLNNEKDTEDTKMESVRKAYTTNKLESVRKAANRNKIFLYIFILGIYRALYILNWIYRYNYEGFYDIIAIFGGCIQTLIYTNYFYFYVYTFTMGHQFNI